MAYMSQDRKKEMAPAIKAVLKKYGMKGTLSVGNHSTLICTIRSGELDVIGNYISKLSDEDIQISRIDPSSIKYIDVNHYWLERSYSGRVLDFLKELSEAMNVGNHDNSDIMTDYFDVGWYVDIKIGRWEMPYELTA